MSALFNKKKRLSLTFCLHYSIKFSKWLKLIIRLIDFLIDKGNWHYDAGEVEHIHNCRIPIVLELVMSDSCRGSNRGNNSIKLLAKFLLNFSDLG